MFGGIELMMMSPILGVSCVSVVSNQKGNKYEENSLECTHTRGYKGMLFGSL